MAKTLKFKDGREYEVLEESGKYYVCKNNERFRRSDSDIKSVSEKKEEKKQEEEWEDIHLEEEPVKEEKKKSAKANSKRSKKGEE